MELFCFGKYNVFRRNQSSAFRIILEDGIIDSVQKELFLRSYGCALFNNNIKPQSERYFENLKTL